MKQEFSKSHRQIVMISLDLGEKLAKTREKLKLAKKKNKKLIKKLYRKTVVSLKKRH